MTLAWSVRNAKPTTHIWARIQRAAELAWGLYDDAETAGHYKRDLFLPLAIESCKLAHCLSLIPGICESGTIPADNLPPLFAKNTEDLLLILQSIRDQLHSLQADQQIVRHRIEQFQRDLNRLERMFNVRSPSAGGVDGIPSAAADGADCRVLRPLSSFNLTLSAIADVAAKIYMVLLLHIPSLYSSRFQGLRSGAEPRSEFEMQHLSVRPGDNLGTTVQSERALESSNTLSRILVKEWAALRILSGLVLATIFSIFQISGLWGNQVMMVAAVFSLAALVYGAVLTIFVNGWRDDSGVPTWVKSTYEPFKIGFLWNTWILLGLPAIWTTWGVIFFFLSSAQVWISAQVDDPGATTLPRSAVAHPWFIPLFAVAVIYLMLMICTLWRLSRSRQHIVSPLVAV